MLFDVHRDQRYKIMSKTFSVKTLGCKLNQYESTGIISQFVRNGWQIRPFGEKVDVVIVNTCSVTDNSDRKCRNYIRQGARFSKNGKTVVTGCMAEAGQDVLKKMPEVETLIPNSKKDDILNEIWGMDSESRSVTEEIPYSTKSRGFIKIQDGCDNFCSYCIVPYVRGKPVSRDINEVVDNAKKLIDEGFYELVLTGITIGKYNFDGNDFADLLGRLINIRGEFRIRITSIEPVHFDDRLLELYSSDRICKHIHLPLQSGSAEILKLMKRGYTSAEYQNIIEKIKTLYPEMAIGTDIIVGFPGENENHFEESLRMIERSGFAYVHCFKYSKRRGTPASEMAQTGSVSDISDRVKRLKEQAAETGLKYRKQFVGRIFKSVIEKKKSGCGIKALTDNYIKIDIEDNLYDVKDPGKVLNVKLLGINGTANSGIIID